MNKEKVVSPHILSIEDRVKSIIRDVADFPKEGIIFKDLTTLLLDPKLCRELVAYMVDQLDSKPDAVAAIESRGFWFGPMLAQALDVPFIPIRKKGKLPGETVEMSYELEYGRAIIEVHKGHIQPGWNVMVHDDLLATGGTAEAAVHLINSQHASVHSFSFLVTLDFLSGRKQLEHHNIPIHSVITYQ